MILVFNIFHKNYIMDDIMYDKRFKQKNIYFYTNSSEKNYNFNAESLSKARVAYRGQLAVLILQNEKIKLLQLLYIQYISFATNSFFSFSKSSITILN